MYRGWTKIDYQDKHCITDQTDKGTDDDRGRDGRTNFTWRIKEQATRLTPLLELDDDDLRRLRLELGTELSAKNKIQAIGSLAVLVL